MKRARRISGRIVLISILLSTVFSYGAVFAAVGGRPAEPDPDNPRSQSIFIYTLKAGETKKDKLFLSNSGDSEETVDLYPVDGVVTNTGSYTCEQKVEDRSGVGSWIKLAQDQVTVPAKGSLVVDFTVLIPSKVDVGEHNGCIAIERVGQEEQGTGSIHVRTRQAVRMAVIIPGDIYRVVTIDSFKAVDGKNNRQYDIILKNTGNVSADTDIKITLKDIFGNEVYKNGGQYVTIANEKLELLFDDTTKPFFGGWFTAKASIAYDKRAGTFGTADKTQLITSESAPVTVFIWPSVWAFILLGFLVLFVVAFFVWRRREKRVAKSAVDRSLSKNTTQTWGKYTVKDGDTLQLLAERYSTTAVKIATLNKIPMSTDLKIGSTIYVPRN